MVALISTWWVVCLLLAVPAVANRIACVIAARTQSRHDFAIADDLPQTAGEWLRDRLAGSLRAIVTDARTRRSRDAYHVYDSVIELTETTHFKADPVYWAIAAHELGHARLHLRHPLAGALLHGARIASAVLVRLAAGLAIGNLLYAAPRVTDLCFLLFALALVLQSGELLNEGYASVAAYRELRGSAHLTRRHLQAVRGVLLTAYATYAASFVAHALLLTQWHHVERVTGGGRLGELAQLTTLGWIGAAIATVLVLLHTLVTVAQLVRRVRLPGHWLLSLVHHTAITALIYLAWNLSASTGWAWCVLLAVIPVANGFLVVLSIPVVPLRLAIDRLLEGARGRGMHRSPEWQRARAAGHRLIHEGNRTLAAMQADTTPKPGFQLFALVNLLYLPLVGALWLSLLVH